MTFSLSSLSRSFRCHGARLVVLAGLCATAGLPGALKSTDRFTLRELELADKLTPRQFGNLFENFSYSYSPYVMLPDEFLNDRAGDCDDYAILADYVLGKKGYKTRIIRVVLAGSDIAHAVCYVTDNKAYLDYNNRKYAMNLERAGARLRDIAAKVADSFEKNWTSATEYTYSYEVGKKNSRYTVVKTDPPDRDPDRNGPPAP